MSELTELNKIYLENLRGKRRPKSIVLPQDRWTAANAELKANLLARGLLMAVSPDESREHFLYLNTPIIAGDAIAVEMNDCEPCDTYKRISP
jgi:hypothetical protein